MLHTKYLSSRPCSFWEEDVWSFSYWLPWQPEFSMEFNFLNNFERGPSKDHSCKVWLQLAQWLRRRCRLNEIVDAARRTTTDAGQWRIRKAHPEHFVLRWAKNPLFRQCLISYYFTSVTTTNFFQIRTLNFRTRQNSHPCNILCDIYDFLARITQNRGLCRTLVTYKHTYIHTHQL